MFWGEAEEILTPEEKIITQEEKEIWKTIITIYDREGVDVLINYFFKNLEYKKYEQADIILEFFHKITATGRLPLKISSRTEKRLVQEAQIERNRKSQRNNYNMRLGKILFGSAKFTRMLNGRV